MKQSIAYTNKSVDKKLSAKTKFNDFLKPSLIALAVSQSFSIAATQAATIYVGGSNGAGCELSQAILSANNDASEPGSQCVAGSGDDVIELNQNVTLTEAWKMPGQNNATYFGLPTISSNLTINGNGHTINRDLSAPDFGIISANRNELILNDISIINGAKSAQASTGPFGMGTAVDGYRTSLIINNSIISNNEGERAIGLSGSLELNNSTVSNNNQGVYFSGGDIDITGSTISNNDIGLFGYTPNSLSLTDSFIDSNGTGVLVKTNDPFGFIFTGLVPLVRIENTSVSNNDSGGLDLASVERIEIVDSDISNNTGDSCAGLKVSPDSVRYVTDSTGFYGPGSIFEIRGSVDSTIKIDNSTISNNLSETVGGGACFYSNEVIEYDLQSANTAVVGISSPSVTILNSTFSGNIAAQNGGAILFQGPTSYSSPYNSYSGQFDFSVNISNTIINSTFSSNSAGLNGGALFLDGNSGYNGFGNSGSRQLSLINSTLVVNSATNGGGIASTDLGATNLSFTNSIVAGNSAMVSGSEVNHLSALSYPGQDLVESNNNVLGSSLVSNYQAFSGFVPSTTDITATIDGNSPAMLDEIVRLLQDNGGVTKTHSLPAGSPAIDAAALDTCINDPVSALDQRGVARGELGLCDIGAYEAGTMSALPIISIEAVKPSIFEGNPGDSRVLIYTFKLSSPQSENVMFDYQAMDGTAVGGVDYQTSSGRITFAPGQVSRIRAIEVIGDSDIESDETFNVMISNATNNAMLDPNQSQASGTILNDDRGTSLPAISVEATIDSVAEGDSNDSRVLVYTFKLSSPQSENVKFDFQTMDETAIGGVDYQIMSGQITFAPGQVSRVRAIQVIGDSDSEPDETFKVVLSNPTVNAMIDQTQSQAIGTIRNDDGGASLPTISVESTIGSVFEGNATDSRVLVYTFKLSSPQSEKVMFDFQTMDETAVGGVDYQINSGRITFASGQVSRIRTINVIGDANIESNETLNVVLSNPTDNAILDQNQLQATGTILNDDR